MISKVSERLMRESSGTAVLDKPGQFSENSAATVLQPKEPPAIEKETVHTAVSLGERTSQKIVLPFEKKGEYFVEHIEELPAKPVYNFIKRAFDIFSSVLALIVLAIPMAIIALIIKAKSPGPVLYRQERLG